MEEAYEDSVEEIKRAEHLFYVSLKYTRTVDVIRSFIDRLVGSFDYGMLCLLKYAKEKKKIKDIPVTPIARCQLVEKTFEDINIKEYIDFYLLFRRLLRAPYTKREEYRRHVTMTSDIDGKPTEVNIDISKEYYDKTIDFLKLVSATARPKK
ncbi:MAG: hypothetical protein U9O94_03025 [Nanoarchaeota archaeon]|nr:hypothetical protein [Nanoarchaeota archaeon]